VEVSTASTPTVVVALVGAHAMSTVQVTPGSSVTPEHASAATVNGALTAMVLTNDGVVEAFRRVARWWRSVGGAVPDHDSAMVCGLTVGPAPGVVVTPDEVASTISAGDQSMVSPATNTIAPVPRMLTTREP
jgi:hypothetical protein